MEKKESFQIKLIPILIIIIVIIIGIVLLVKVNQKEKADEIEKNNASTIAGNDYTNPTFVSESGAQVLLKEKFYVAIDLYNLSRYYFKISEQPVKNENQYVYLIEDYEEVLKDNFTDKMIKDFEKNANGLVKYDDKYWSGDSDDKESTLDSIKEFKDVKIEENRIVSTVCTIHYNGDDKKEKIKENKFVLVKENNNWLIDEFHYSDLY